MFDIMITIIGHLDDEAEAVALARDVENCLARAKRLGLAIDVRDARLAKIIHQRIVVPPSD